MPILPTPGYRTPAGLFGGHLQTVVPALLRRVKGVHYQPQRIVTDDGDFLDLFWARHTAENRPLAVLCHGLEGDAHRPYILGMVRALQRAGWDALAWNYRGCGGTLNHLPRFYHSGATDDLARVLDHVRATTTYARPSLIGFSLGGNLVLKYLGEGGAALRDELHRAVVFSVPCHLADGARNLGRWQNRVYHARFMASLRRKILSKAGRISTPANGPFCPDTLAAVRTLEAFDDKFTAPLHGFASGADYYARCSALGFLDQIRVDTLIVNATNDPMLPPACYPTEAARHHPHVFLEMPTAGGHCGFATRGTGGLYWSERRALAFLEHPLPAGGAAQAGAA